MYNNLAPKLKKYRVAFVIIIGLSLPSNALRGTYTTRRISPNTKKFTQKQRLPSLFSGNKKNIAFLTVSLISLLSVGFGTRGYYQKELKSLKNKVIDLQNSEDKSIDKQPMNESDKEKNQLVEEKKQLMNEKNRLIEELDKLKQKVQAQTSITDSLSGKTQSDFDVLLQESEEGKRKAEELANENQHLRNQLNVSHKKPVQSVEILESEYDIDNENSKQKNIVLNNENEKLRQDIQKKKEVIRSLQQSVSQSEEGRIEELVNQNSSLNDQLDRCTQEAKQTILDLENKNRELTDQNKRLQGSLSAQPAQNINKDESKEVKKLKNKIKDLNSKVSVLSNEQRMGKGIESAFTKEEDFLTQKVVPLQAQALRNLHECLYDDLQEKYEELQEQEEEANISKNTKTKFELLIDRVIFEFMDKLMKLSYQSMEKRKATISKIVAKQMKIKKIKEWYNVENGKNEKGTPAKIAANLIHSQLQQQWEDYFKNEMKYFEEDTTESLESMKNKTGDKVYQCKATIVVDEIDKVVDNIFDEICNDSKYKAWKFLEENDGPKYTKAYIKGACEVSWIMVLAKPKMTFYPSSFRELVKKEEKLSSLKEGRRNLWEGSDEDESAKLLFFAIPAIDQVHFLEKDGKRRLFEGLSFASNDEALREYIMKDPEELLKQSK